VNLTLVDVLDLSENDYIMDENIKILIAVVGSPIVIYLLKEFISSFKKNDEKFEKTIEKNDKKYLKIIAENSEKTYIAIKDLTAEIADTKKETAINTNSIKVAHHRIDKTDEKVDKLQEGMRYVQTDIARIKTTCKERQKINN